MSDHPSTRISTATPEDVFVRGRSLTRDLMGSLSFSEMMFLHVMGRAPTAAEARVVDACLVALMEHGLTPTVIAARMTYTSAPEAMQGAVAAGLASVGSLYVGTMEGCGVLLARLVAADDLEAEATAVVAEHRAARAHVPGFGHPLHKPDDPRARRLFEIAEEVRVAGAHVAAIRALSTAVDAGANKHVTINATGAIAAVLADCGVPPEILRGFALVSRCAGLVGHIREEQEQPVMHALWKGASDAVPFEE